MNYIRHVRAAGGLEIDCLRVMKRYDKRVRTKDQGFYNSLTLTG